MSNPTTQPARAARKILIIEDEGEMCLLLNIILNGRKMDLNHVKDLEHAKEYLKKEKPSMVILDNRLPDGLGVDFVGYIKNNYPDTRIIMISGYGSAARDTAIENGADEFIEKPFSKEQLFESIERLSAVA